MRICRFDNDRLGLVAGDAGSVLDVTAALDALPKSSWPYPFGDPLIANLPAVRRRIEEVARSAPRKPLSSVRLNSPVATPSKIIAAPVNYKAHLDEARADAEIHHGSQIKVIEQCGLFLKASSSLVGPSEGVHLPDLGRRIDHEIELALIIGKPGRFISREQAIGHIAGYSIALDMTVRGPEDRSWRKSFDDFAVLGPWFVTADEIAEPGELKLSLKVNGQERQSANTRDLVFDMPKLIEYASSTYTLYPGDIIMTGTPEGVASVQAGDVLDCEIEGVGEMRVNIEALERPQGERWQQAEQAQ